MRAFIFLRTPETASGSSWHQNDPFITGTFLNPGEKITEFANVPVAPDIPYMHDQETSTDVGEASSQVIL